MRTETDEQGHQPLLYWVNHYAVSPREGGGTRHFELGRDLVRRGWAVRIMASDLNLHSRQFTRRAPGQREMVEEMVDGVGFRWLWAAPYAGNDWRRLWNWVSFARSALKDTAELERPSVVIGSSPHLLAALAGSRMARRWKVPFVLEVRDLWPESLRAAGGRRGPAYVVLDLLARYLYRRADRIVYLAPGTGSYLAEQRAVPEHRLVYVPNGVDPDAFPPVERGGRSTFTLVYTGAHGPANDLDVVLDAARLLADRDSIRFVLVGDGPAKQTLVRRSHDEGLKNVEFRDPVPKSEMAGVLASADAGLMVLRDTPLFAFGVSPNKLFDYMGAGLPIVCNVPGVVAEMVKRAGAGVQADAGSARSLADAVLRLASTSEAARRSMGRSAREWVAREHGRRPLGARLDQALTTVVRG